MERAIKSSKDPRPFLKYMEYYVEECLQELNDIDTPCYKEENYGKSGEQPPMTPQCSNMIYEVIPRLTEALAYTQPNKSSVFAVNHFFRLILILCKRCIELDIECFRLLEIIFGFIKKMPTKFRFYDCCGQPKSTGGYRRHDYIWLPKEYGNGEMSLLRIIYIYNICDFAHIYSIFTHIPSRALYMIIYRFLRIRELEKLKQQTQDKLDALRTKSEEIEEYEEEIEIEEEQKDQTNNDDDKTQNEAIKDDKEDKPNPTDDNIDVDDDDDAPNDETKDDNDDDDDNGNNKDDKDKTEETADAPNGHDKDVESKDKDKKIIKVKKTIKKTRTKQLSEEETQMIDRFKHEIQSYETELNLMITESKKYYEIGHYNDYAIDVYQYCGGQNEKSRDESWFRVQNINYWGKIGGFETILKRISHAKCAVAVSDLVNLIRPVAQV